MYFLNLVRVKELKPTLESDFSAESWYRIQNAPLEFEK